MAEGIRVESGDSAMRIIVVSSAMPDRLHTLHLLTRAGVEHDVVVHNNDHAKRIASAGVSSNIIVSRTTTLVEKRNFILKSLVKRGEWFIGMDDNIRGFTRVREQWYSNDRNNVHGDPPHNETWRGIYNADVCPKTWLQSFQCTIKSAGDAPLVGVATMENPYFRDKQISRYRFVKTKVFAMRNEKDLYFKHEMCHDSFLTALAIARYGSVVVNNYLHHKSTMYEAGGLGNRKEREAKGLLTQLEDICREFDGLVMMGSGENTALRIRLTTNNGVKRWREQRSQAE